MANNGKVTLPAPARMQIALLMTVLIFAVFVPAEEQTPLEKLRTVEDVQDRVREVEERIRKIDLSADKTEEQFENLQKLHRLRFLLDELLREKVEALTVKAKQGDAWAQLELGAMYDEGESVPQDHKLAVYWYRKAAEQGDIAPAVVQLPLLAMAFRGNTDARAFLAERGHAAVQFDLGRLYYRDDSIFKNHRQAAYWYRKSAEQGYAQAQVMLGAMYLIGSGVPDDYIQAYAWLNLAAAQDIEKAKETKAILREQLTPAQVVEAQALSREFAARIEAGQ